MLISRVWGSLANLKQQYVPCIDHCLNINQMPRSQLHIIGCMIQVGKICPDTLQLVKVFSGRIGLQFGNYEHTQYTSLRSVK